VCQEAARISEQLPRMEAQMVAAAESAEVMARWTPLEKKGSINAFVNYQWVCGIPYGQEN